MAILRGGVRGCETRAALAEQFFAQGSLLVGFLVTAAANQFRYQHVDDILEMASMPVIFITAYPERLLTGNRPEPTYLITKPFQESTVRAAISQALFFGSSRPLN